METDDPTKHIFELIEQDKLDEARKELGDLIAGEMSAEEKGRVLTETALTYISIMNDLNDRYIASMEQRLKQLEEVSGIADQLDKKIDLAETREKIMNS